MTCADFEILLCDYLDGTLDEAGRRAVEEHRDNCASCRELAQDVSAAMGLMERAAEPVVPPELLTRIAFEIPAGSAHAQAKRGLFAGLTRWLQPVLQPRFAMGMAMTILSFSLLGRFAGIEVRQLSASDLRPSAVWMAVEDRAARSWDRAVRYYEGLRIVYQIRTQLEQFQREDEGSQATTTEAQPGAAKPAQNPQKDKNGKATK